MGNNENLKKVKDSCVLKELCEFVDKETKEKKSYYRWWIVVGGIKCKCTPSREGMEVIEQLGYELEEVD